MLLREKESAQDSRRGKVPYVLGLVDASYLVFYVNNSNVKLNEHLRPKTHVFTCMWPHLSILRKQLMSDAGTAQYVMCTLQFVTSRRCNSVV